MAIDGQVITQSPHVATLGDELTTSRLVDFPSYKLSFKVVVEDISPVAGTGQQVVVVQTWCSVRQW